ncbi:MAG: 50S ribosomal protein L19 [Candidatus Moranbacteria bacterium]|nr:50S ribosomal protein L19 [Candidatus Moranbacteria bacterium]
MLMHKDLIGFNMSRRTKEIPALHAGDVVKIHRKIVEGGKERVQVFQGMVIAMRGGQSSSPTVTVRKVSFGIGVEIVVPIYSPNIEKIEVLKSTRSRRAKLYFVREKSAKLLRRKLKEVGLKVGKGKKSGQDSVAERMGAGDAEAEILSEAVAKGVETSEESGK